MPINRSAEYDLVNDYLGYEWIPVEQLYTDLINKVLPGKAIRKYDTLYAQQNAKASGLAPPKGPLSRDDKILSGARSILRDVLRSAISNTKILEQKVGNVKFVRSNRFTSSDVDKILADKVNELLAVSIPPEPVQSSPIQYVQLALFDVLLDIRTVKQVIVQSQNGQVSMRIPNVADDQPLNVFLTSDAADFLSDQLGIQALSIRNGRPNRLKAIPVHPTK